MQPAWDGVDTELKESDWSSACCATVTGRPIRTNSSRSAVFQIGTVTNVDVVVGDIAIEVGISNELAELVFTFDTYVG